MVAADDIEPGGVRLAVTSLLGADPGAVDWQLSDVEHHQVHSTTGWLARLTGVTATGEPWSLVVKATRLGTSEAGALWTSAADPAHRNYWKREYLAFATGLLGALPGRLRAPRCLLTTEPAPDHAWIWMQDVQGTSGRRWSHEHFAAAASDLGTTQGSYLAGTPLPRDEWLSSGWLRSWFADVSAAWRETSDDATLWRDERLAPLLPLWPKMADFASGADTLLAMLDAAPQTIIHGDFWPPNLFTVGDGRTVAVDWSSVGIGTVAHDLDQITLDPVWMQLREPAEIEVLERTVLAAYADGLRLAGADVADSDLRRWYAAAAALHFGLNAGLIARGLRAPEQVAAQEQRWQRPFAEIVARRAPVVARALDLGLGALG